MLCNRKLCQQHRWWRRSVVNDNDSENRLQGSANRAPVGLFLHWNQYPSFLCSIVKKAFERALVNAICGSSSKRHLRSSVPSRAETSSLFLSDLAWLHMFASCFWRRRPSVLCSPFRAVAAATVQRVEEDEKADLCDFETSVTWLIQTSSFTVCEF